MALSLIDTSNSSSSASGSLTFAHDCTGADLIVVAVNTYDGTSSVNAEVSGITFNGDALTQAVEQQGLSGTNNWSEIWYKVNPASGSYNVVVTTSGGSADIGGGAMSFSGADTGTPIDDSVGETTNGGTTVTPTVTTTADGNYVLSCAQTENNVIDSIGGGQTSLWNLFSGYSRGSYEIDVTAGSITHTYTNANGSERWCSAMVSINTASSTTIPHIFGDEGMLIGNT